MAASKKKETIYVRECVAVAAHSGDAGSVLVVSTNEERTSFNSAVFRFESIDKTRESIFLVDEWLTSMWVSPTGTYWLAGVLGDVLTNVSSSFVSTKVSGKRLFRIWGRTDAEVYAVGPEGVCMRFDGERWQDFSEGLAGKNIHVIGGKDRLVCAGDGFAARHDGERWVPIAGVAGGLRSLYEGEDSTLYLGGLEGALYRVTADKTQSLDGGAHDWHAMARFKDTLYVTSPSAGVFKVEGDRLAIVKDIAKGYAADASETLLWTCGLQQLARFDGEGWRKVEFF